MPKQAAPAPTLQTSPRGRIALRGGRNGVLTPFPPRHFPLPPATSLFQIKWLRTGSGGNYALSAARALAENTELPARTIVEKSLGIAGEICVYTNCNFTIEELAP